MRGWSGDKECRRWKENRNNSDQLLALCSDAIRNHPALTSPGRVRVQVCGDNNLTGEERWVARARVCVWIWVIKSSISTCISGKKQAGKVKTDWNPFRHEDERGKKEKTEVSPNSQMTLFPHRVIRGGGCRWMNGWADEWKSGVWVSAADSSGNGRLGKRKQVGVVALPLARAGRKEVEDELWMDGWSEGERRRARGWVGGVWRRPVPCWQASC